LIDSPALTPFHSTSRSSLRAYTSAAAYAAFQEGEKGTLEVGKVADFVIVDRDLRRVPPETLRDAKVLLTVVGGTVVYPAPRP